MKKFLSATIFLLICAATTICFAEPGGAMRLGILPVFKAATVSADLTLDDTEIATGAIYAGMTNCADFEILSRTDVDKLVQEHELTATGLIDTSTAPVFGKMLGAEYLLITNVTGLSSRKKTASVVGTGSKNYIVTARMAGRIVEVESGRVVLAATSSATSGNKMFKVTGGLIKIGTDEVDQGLADEALEKAAENLVDKLLENLENKKRARQ
mgnify:CR=1 FL=1